jgi:Membrane protein involved in the export of O-antigen and teichoic acid
MSDLKNKSLKQVKWVSFGRILPKIFAPITTILLVNVFVPSDYGIVGICGAFISFMALLQGLGIDDYVIREQNLTDEKINTAFWANFIVSCVFCLLLVLTAPIIASFYKQEQISSFLPVLSINLILNAVGFVPWTLLRKKLEFKRLFFINFAPLIISLSVTLPLGYMKFGAWAIVAGSITLTFLTNAYFIFQSRWRPKFIFSKNEIDNIFNFGKFVIFERIQEYLYANIDVFLIGFFIDLKTLGIYTLAKSWSWLIFGMVTGPMSEILYPAFQQFSNDTRKMGEQFLKVEQRMFFITVPIFLLIAGFATKTVVVIFPVRWAEAGLVLAFLIVGDGISKSFSLQRDLFKLIGRPDIYPKAFMINFIYTIIGYPLGAKFGLMSFLCVRVGNDILYTGIQYYLTRKIFGYSNEDFYKIIRSALISGSSMIVSIISLNYIFYAHIVHLNIFTLGISLLLSVLVYMIMYYMTDKNSITKYYGEGKVVLGIK